MKAILISIKPKWVAKILNGEKTVEIRRKFPKDYFGWVYIYCTKEKWKTKPLLSRDIVIKPNADPLNKHNVRLLNGKVVARFWCDKVDDYVNGRKWSWKVGAPMWGACNGYECILKDACLTDDELRNYADDLAFNAIHISKLEIFNYPYELCEFHTNVKKEPPEELLCPECGKPMEYYEYKYLTKAPQSWCYVEDDSL